MPANSRWDLTWRKMLADQTHKHVRVPMIADYVNCVTTVRLTVKQYIYIQN